MRTGDDETDVASIAAERVKAVVERWGAAFAALADNPRLNFDDDEAIEITLWKPITVSGEITPVLSMREPTLAEMKKIDGIKGEMAQASRMVVSSCAITENEAGKIGMRDFGVIAEILMAFSPAAPGTGRTQ